MSVDRKRNLAIATAITLSFGFLAYIGLLMRSNETYDYAKEEQVTSVALAQLELNNVVEVLYKGRPAFILSSENGDPIVLEGISRVSGTSVNYIVRYGPGTLMSGEEYSYYSNGHGTYYKLDGSAIQTYQSLLIENLQELKYEIRENQVVLKW